MTYMDMLQGNTRTSAPVVKRATITDTRTAQNYARTVAAQDFRPDPEIRAVMRQRYGVCG